MDIHCHIFFFGILIIGRHGTYDSSFPRTSFGVVSSGLQSFIISQKRTLRKETLKTDMKPTIHLRFYTGIH